ncbi:hypothetical protein [Microcystis aeruginosa]|jgi:hypothetical protein|uniref:hypothetical protein n=1 Tax=Microcystis aeruginosa TaxID=1126 RepID=UPI00232BF159|nr:hypothetical protein [Microcystis aeruginosa]MDB9397967.1 hypothetical protein [Microcystis aeruginosa CS-573]
MYQSINSQNITANEELIVNLFEAIDSSDFKLLVKYFDKNIIYGTCALIMYLLGERSSPLHCGQNPLL